MRLSLPVRPSAAVPQAATRLPRALVVAAVPVTVVVVLAGVWVTGGLVTDDEPVARRLMGAWFAGAGVLAALVALRWRPLAVPVLAAWFLTSGSVGGYLMFTSSVDRVVHEQVTVAEVPSRTPAGDSPATTGATTEPPGPVAVAAGEFADGAHPTSGTATLIDRPDGTRALTLTGFATDPGPDLRVLLVRDRAGTETGSAVDLGALKGNKGDQQYTVPPGSPAGAVVIWCRAFTVAFGTASLTAA
jgi:hypothetical protein